jgi:hypothetical protein
LHVHDIDRIGLRSTQDRIGLRSCLHDQRLDADARQPAGETGSVVRDPVEPGLERPAHQRDPHVRPP